MKMDEIIREVSIHAPVKGATSISSYSGCYPKVSIHAPVKGATWLPVVFLVFS